MNAVVEQPELMPEFLKIEALEADKAVLLKNLQMKDSQINKLRTCINKKLASLSGFVSSREDAELMIYTLNSYYKFLVGVCESAFDSTSLAQQPNIFTWLMAYNIVKASNPELIEFDGEEKFVVSVYLAFHSTPGADGEPRMLAYGSGNCVFVASDNFKFPEVCR